MEHNESSDLKYLSLLAESFPTAEAICSEISRISAQLSLPKGTEHFMSDIHGEYEAFCHIMKNCSGVIREKVVLWLGSEMTSDEIDSLCTLIYYPNEIIKHLHKLGADTPEWYREQIGHMVVLARMLSSKYTRRHVRDLMSDEWRFILEELLHDQADEGETEQERNRRRYHNAIVDSVIETESARGLIHALATLIKDLAVARLHVVGDIYDRGPRADDVMDILMHHHSVDIEWGNHDVLWMGAASGSDICIAQVLRNCLAYGNTGILERGYAIPLRPLALRCEQLYPELPVEKAMAHAALILMLKLEGQLIERNPEFGMQSHMFLHCIDYEHHTVTINGTVYPCKTEHFNTVDPDDPYRLTEEEQMIIDRLRSAFTHSIRLHDHISFLYRRGWMYRTFNHNLLFHGCIPMNPDGSFKQITFGGKTRSGRSYMDYCDQMARRAFYKGDQASLDFMWYLWCGSDSPVYGREIKTFARAFIPDESTWEEPRNPYYLLYNDEAFCDRILLEFGLDPASSHIINGHTPVRVTHGESPLKGGGKLIVIDGGFCRAYQKTTGIAGYTLISNSHGMRLMSHQPFTTLRDAIQTGRDIHSQSFEFVRYPRRQYARDTEHGAVLEERRQDLLKLLSAVRNGDITLQK